LYLRYPEIASVGLTEKQAKEKDTIKLVNSVLSFRKAKLLVLRRFCKNFDAKYGEWLGCHMIGAGVTDMIAEAIVARKLETTGHEILKSIHPHPTMRGSDGSLS
jgi:dihydrolipoamide dehydrogenase